MRALSPKRSRSPAPSADPPILRARARYLEERAELLAMLQKDGILYASETQPVVSRDGTHARWMLDSLRVSLTPRGAELAGRCLLELLSRFDGAQLATYGVT